MEGQTILLLDEDKKTLDFLAAFLVFKGCLVIQAADAEDALQRVEESAVDMVIADTRMQHNSGIEFIKNVKDHRPEIVIIAYSPFVNRETTEETLKAGAFAVMEKPFNLERLETAIRQGLEHQELQARSLRHKPKVKNRDRLKNIIGESEKMQELFEMVEKVAGTDSTIMIHGESGTGKELVAHAIHDLSSRAEGNFVAVNCAAIPDDLLESELFGHVKGSFTGAVVTRLGRFELANKGTLFLDEIGDMKPNLQVKLLRVLQSREVEPVGGTRPKKVDVRIIAATNQNLEQMVAEKTFREDLYYRLSVIPIHLPPLRERGSDIKLLLNSFLNKFNKVSHRKVEGFDDQVTEILTHYRWPGNVRELENLVERLVIVCNSPRVGYEDLPEKYRGGRTVPREGAVGPAGSPQMVLPASGISLQAAVEEFENGLILQALQKTGGNKKEAAILLNLKRTTLIEKLKKKNLAYTPHP
ncbi:sigma-54 dependent transcriptional regulator [Geomonas sp. Red32]|uniref:sigma-54-dependent transcriptional regulator n=1 Tax=Geomonas sp. Red32 TaxID=2912856 RepID=UPI00202D09B5|nr:sigma-54 dependent transcriptional regulator [Geomonas sp. Red32]MCM0080161.1 sigma-54 dependent transcriptional regulator [Geomonas sp. Red32]